MLRWSGWRGDEDYSRSARLRGFSKELGIGYVVGFNFDVHTGVGPIRADVLVAMTVSSGPD